MAVRRSQANAAKPYDGKDRNFSFPTHRKIPSAVNLPLKKDRGRTYSGQSRSTLRSTVWNPTRCSRKLEAKPKYEPLHPARTLHVKSICHSVFVSALVSVGLWT